MLKARFLGIPQITIGTENQSVALTGRMLALFVYLCVTRQPQDRSKLADLLWDNLPEAEAKANLRYIIRNLRKEIGDYIVADAQYVGFNFELPHWFDIAGFTTYLAPKMQAASSAIDTEILQALLNLYNGDFLEGNYIQNATNFDRWLLTQRRHLHDMLVYGLQIVTEQNLATGNYEVGLALNHFLLTLEPWREEAHRQRMILLATSGQRSAALVQYELCCQILEKELDVSPMDETTSLYLRIKSGRWFVEPRTVTAFAEQRVSVNAYPIVTERPTTPNRMSPLNSSEQDRNLGAMPAIHNLIGRETELQTLQQWLRNKSCRLVSIGGLNGQGKSALAAWLVQQAHKQANPSHQAQFPSPDKDSEFVQNWPFPTLEKQNETALGDEWFTKIIWRSLLMRPTCIELLQDLVQLLSGNESSRQITNFDELVTLLFAMLAESRTLIVLDGVEMLFSDDGAAGQIEAAPYEHLFDLLLDRPHRSCIVVTGRLRPSVLTRWHHKQESIYSLQLEGLTKDHSAAFLAAQGIEAEMVHYDQLHEWYQGNPRMLSQAAALIHELFDSNAATFLQEGVHFLDTIGATFAQQIGQLCPLQQQILQILGVSEQPLTRQQVREQLPAATAQKAFFSALRNLQDVYMVYQRDGAFTAAALPAALLSEQVP